MRFDGWDSMEGRHLVFAYATVLLLQFGYFTHVAVQYFKLDPEKQKAGKPL